METKGKVAKHKELSVHYFENALHYMQIGDVEKASEFLWGSLSQSLKALALNKGVKLMSHDSIKRYAKEISKSLHDESIWYAYEIANSLHGNFYESGKSLEDISSGADLVKRTVEKLLSMIPKEN